MDTRDPAFLIINAGSSSIKFSIYDALSEQCLYYGATSLNKQGSAFWVKNKHGTLICQEVLSKRALISTVQPILQWLNTINSVDIIGAGHRIVHGGVKYIKPTIIDDSLIDELTRLIPLAPLHQPIHLEAIKAIQQLKPDLKQIACFDTAFHCTQTELSKYYAIPNIYFKNPIMRYGFHGLSYHYIASIAPDYLTPDEQRKVIVAHLGNGASLCAMKNLQSITTTMGFTPLDGLIMGTRCGNIDPGIIFYLIHEKNLSTHEVQKLLYEESGLQGISGMSHDMNVLLKSNNASAQLAIELFCYQAAKQLASLLPTLEGIDTFIFTAGIGENSPEIRRRICQYFSWLGLQLDDVANNTNNIKVSASTSAISVYAIPTNEALMIAKLIQPLF